MFDDRDTEILNRLVKALERLAANSELIKGQLESISDDLSRIAEAAETAYPPE